MERPSCIAKTTVAKKNNENGLVMKTDLSLEDQLALSPSYAAIQDSERSGIRLVLSETVNNESGGYKNEVTAVIPTWVFDQAKTVCQRSIGQPVYPNTGDVAAAILSQKKLYTAVHTLLNSLTRGLYEVCTQGDNLAVAVDTSVKDALESVSAEEGKSQTANFLNAGDAVQKSEVIYGYKTTQKMATTSNLTMFAKTTIQRLTCSGQNRPWTITIRNFHAVAQNNNGTPGYVKDSVEQDHSIAISISDNEMYRLAYTVEHFVSQWERSTLNTFIQSRNSYKC